MSTLRQSYDRMAGAQRHPFQRPLTLNGIAGGSTDMGVDGSGVPKAFLAGVTAGQIWTIHKLSISVSDFGNTTTAKYGSVSGPLQRGVEISLFLRGVNTVLIPAVKTTVGYFETGSAVQVITLSGTSRVSNFIIDFADYSDGLILDGDHDTDGDAIVLLVQDNLSGLTLHQATIIGNYRVKAAT